MVGLDGQPCRCPGFLDMCRLTDWSLLFFSAAALMAANPSWKTKPIRQWTAEDARQVLEDSPWVKRAAIAILPQRSEAQMREGGKMGGGGRNAGLGPLSDIGRGATLEVRWESAGAVRAAELKAGDSGPDWDGDYYAIAVYDVPGITPLARKTLESDLKQTTLLKRDGKKGLKPARVEIVLLGKNLARMVYLFPRSPEITLADERVQFVTQIGRLYIAPSFDLTGMQFEGKLDL